MEAIPIRTAAPIIREKYRPPEKRSPTAICSPRICLKAALYSPPNRYDIAQTIARYITGKITIGRNPDAGLTTPSSETEGTIEKMAMK